MSPLERAARALTADDVFLIARRVAADVVDNRIEAYLSANGYIAGVAKPEAPPAPPAAAKRVEAWMDPVTGCVTLIDPGATSGWTYLTTFPGVTDAASAERMMAAMRHAWEWIVRQPIREGIKPAADDLLPFLPPVPR